MWVNRTSHNLAFVFPNRLDYGTSDANSLCLQISDVSYNFHEKINFSPDMQEKGSNLPRDSPHHVFVQLLAKRKKHDGKHPKKLRETVKTYVTCVTSNREICTSFIYSPSALPGLQCDSALFEMDYNFELI